MRYLITANHHSPIYQLNDAAIEVRGEAGNYSVSIPRFGYVCGFTTPKEALYNILFANGCYDITIRDLIA